MHVAVGSVPTEERSINMRNLKTAAGVATLAAMVGVVWFSVARMALAHCDTMDGPVVTEAQEALEKGDVTAVLKWVKTEHEEEVRAVFKKVLAARTKSPEAREVADMYFFETL